MGLFSGLFGGGGTKTTTQQLPILTPEQMDILRILTAQAKESLGGTTAYPKQMYVPTTPEEQMFISWASQIGEGRLGDISKGTPAYTTSPEQTQAWFRKYEEPAYWQTWQERVLPTIQEQYAGPGYWGSDRARAVTRSAEDLGTQINQTLGQRLYSDELARRQALTDAFNRVVGATTAQGLLAGGSAELSRAIEEQKVMSDLQRWLSGEAVGGVQSPYVGPQVQLALALLGISPYTYQGVTTTTGPGLGYSFLQGTGQALGKLFGSMF